MEKTTPTLTETLGHALEPLGTSLIGIGVIIRVGLSAVRVWIWWVLRAAAEPHTGR
jgi:hypothetical protein